MIAAIDASLVEAVAKAMFAAVRGKDGKLQWGEVDPITQAYRTGARAALREVADAVEAWNGKTRDGDTTLIAFDLREAAGPTE